MSEVDKGYKLKVLKMVANKYLDETISATEESLKALEANCDQVVWELATRIYSQSGHKVELSTRLCVMPLSPHCEIYLLPTYPTAMSCLKSPNNTLKYNHRYYPY